jgi:hypothetical protein
MRIVIVALLALMIGACASRQVQVGTGTQPSGGVSLSVTNNSSQAVNVYVTTGGNDIFVGQVAPNSTQQLKVSGVASGSTVALKAATADGTRTYRRDNITLTDSYAWTVP